MRRVAAVLVTFLILGGCTRQEATARLKADIPVDYHRNHSRSISMPLARPALLRLQISRQFEGGIQRWQYLLELFNTTMDLANSARA
jgi:hypothetical protein